MLDDQSARERIRTDLETTLLVEAGAGSGKTTSLVGRMLSLIETGAARAEQIAAITFTRKAADELRARFRLALERRIRETDGEPRQRLRQALQDADRCTMATIHSFCGRLLRERPIEAGLDPQFRELEEEEAETLLHAAWDDYLLLHPELLEAMEPLGLHVEDLRQVYVRANGYRDVEIALEEVPRPDFDRIRLSLPPLLDEAAAYLPSAQPDKGWDALQEAVRDGRRLLRLHGMEEELRLLDLAQRFDRKLVVTQNRWTDKTKAKELGERFLEWQRDVLQPFLQSWREHLYPQAISFVLPAVEHAARLRAERGELDFQDLLLRAARLLREHPEVRSFFSERYTRLLIDEFQDTDPIQAELMFLLTGSDSAQSDWRLAVPRPGSLFVVGDPKQSIYRFRRADISIYNAVKQRIAACGDVLRLGSNFRSARSLGAFVNYEFNSRFPRTETDRQASFVPMETTAPDPADRRRAAHGVVTATIPKLPGGKEAAAREDADRLARYVAWACRDGNLLLQEREADGAWRLRPAEPGDFLLLLKKREFIQLYAEILERYGVPSVTSGSAARCGELAALALLARALNDPEDRIGLLAALKGPLLSVSDSALYHYRMEGHALRLCGLPELREVSAEARPVRLALGMAAGWADIVRASPSALGALMAIAEQLGLLPLAASLPSGTMRAGTLVSVLHALQEDPLACGSWPALARRLEALASEAGAECGELYAGRRSAVRIMNLHKAKGLEAPVVLLACPAGEYDHDATEHVDRSGGKARGYFAITRRSPGSYKDEMIAHPPGWKDLAAREREFLLAEKERLLYVAATRAKQLLVVSWTEDRPAVNPWSPFESSLRDARELDVPELLPAERERYDGVHDAAADAREAAERLARLAAPTYRSASVTELAKSGRLQPPRPAEGRGMAFGSTVHRCLELLGSGSPLAELEPSIRLVAAEEGMAERLLPDARAMLAEVLAHPLWQRAAAARRRVHELQLRAVRRGASASPLSSVGGTVPLQADSVLPDLHLKGIVDFLFEEDDGWVVVDFKTDVHEPAQEGLFAAFYRPQVEAYRDVLEQEFGLRIKEIGLYFLHTGSYAALV